jgi:hypothetical protein
MERRKRKDMGSKIMTRPMIRIHDLETNEVIDREMTIEEFADYEQALASAANRDFN